MNTSTTTQHFSHRPIGIVSLILVLILVLVLIWLLVWVAQPLTRTTAVTERIVESLLTRLEKQSGADHETVRLLMGLENAASGMRLATLQVATATLGGFFLVVIGTLLFAAGANGVFSTDIQGGGFSMSLKDLTPGIAAAIVGGVLIGIGAYREVNPPEIHYKSSPSARSKQDENAAVVSSNQVEIPADSWYMREASAPEETNRELPSL